MENSNPTNPSTPPGDQLTNAHAEWWTAKELAARWRCSTSKISRMHNKDRDNFGRKIGGQLLIHRTHIERLERLDTAAEAEKAHAAAVKRIRDLRRGQRPPTGDPNAPHRKKKLFE
ncbi:MAG TPA: hypothetical protein VHY37_08830 [Tepidisphaeraceae bacterium]|jgi:hypothetical protein|nr:hypothetical protein [Tepidisphaeraceae bacterium]